ncbi:MAG TPA: cysteine--tRNA ligase, partial [Methanomassiliicoccales archaeon]|nr:cysteine--tRNA ligase [Methanomassiliicoccales archaeon]
IDEVLGILPSETTGSGEAEAIVQILIDIRQELRKRKVFDLADEIRDKLAESGVKLEDTAEGVKWKWT